MNFELRATGPVGKKLPPESRNVVPEPEQRIRKTRRELPEVLDIGKKQLEHTIAAAEYVTQEDIRAYVASLVSQYSDILSATPESLLAKQKPLLLAEALSDEGIEAMYDMAIEKLLGEDPFSFSELSKEEQQQAMDPIRRGIIEEFRRQGVDVGDVYMARKEIQPGNIAYVDSKGKEKYKKKNKIVFVDRAADASRHVYRENIFRGPEAHRVQLRAALDVLKQGLETIPEKEKKDGYPYVLDVRRYDPNVLATIVETLDIKETLWDVIVKIKNKQDVIRAFDIWADALAGGDFLVQSGLMLMDIKPANIGVHKKDNEEHGILFDLDGLHRLNESVVQYLSTPEYRAPEERQTRIASEKQMVYQFGATLQDILFRVSNKKKMTSDEQQWVQDLEALAAAMIEKKPEKRLTIASALDRFEDIMDTFDTA